MNLLFPIAYFALINLFIVLVGYPLVSRKQVVAGWLLLVVSITAVTVLFWPLPAIIKMLGIIATTFTAMKVIAVTAEYKLVPVQLTFKQWMVFAGGWAGMRAQPFESLGDKPLPGAWSMVRFGLSRLILGAAFVFAARYVAGLPINSHFRYILVSGMLLVGFSLILHFGLLSISAGMWRLSGANTYYLFRQPAKSTSLSTFWSKRWNLAFSEMTALTVFRPISKQLGNGWALMIAFIFSGLLHELALSVPVNSGYGLPTLYFIIQALVVLMEKWFRTRGMHFLDHKIVARIWVFFWLIVPMPLLFHAAFIHQVLWPMAGMRF